MDCSLSFSLKVKFVMINHLKYNNEMPEIYKPFCILFSKQKVAVLMNANDSIKTIE